MINAILTKPLDGEPEGTIREFSQADFQRLEAKGAVRSAAEGDGLRHDGPTVADYVAAGYTASSYPPHGYASCSTPDEIASAIATEAAAAVKAVPVVATETEAEKAAPVVDNKKAPKVLNKALGN